MQLVRSAAAGWLAVLLEVRPEGGREAKQRSVRHDSIPTRV